MTNNMPERIIAGYGFHGDEWCLPESANVLRLEDTTEYIRADVAAAQLAERDARIAELEAAQAWVSVDERLPEAGQEVITVHPDIFKRPTAFGESQIYVIRQLVTPEGVRWADAGVTHWMPLPPPPVTDETHHR